MKKEIKKRRENEILTPENRSEFEHNISLMCEDALRKIESDDKSAIGSYIAFTAEHIEKVKVLPNGRVNLLTINEQLRSQGNMHNTMPYLPKPEIKKSNTET